MGYEEEINSLREELKAEELLIAEEKKSEFNAERELGNLINGIRKIEEDERGLASELAGLEKEVGGIVDENEDKKTDCDAITKDINYYVRIKDEQKKRILNIEMQDLKN